MRIWIRRLALAFVALCFTAAVVVGALNLWVLWIGQRKAYRDVKAVPRNDVGLVLGTSPRLRGGYSNPFFEGRMNAAAELYRAGKVRHFLLSGDNRRSDYDEPSAMRAALEQRGVPAGAITLDYAGLRTLDSIERARAVFGLHQLTIITDDFHVARSLFLARAKDVDAVGYSGKAVPLRWSKKTRLREIGSRVKACLDVYVLQTKPKHYGKPETITLASDARK